MNKRQRKKAARRHTFRLKRASLKALRRMSRFTFVEEPFESHSPVDVGFSAYLGREGRR